MTVLVLVRPVAFLMVLATRFARRVVVGLAAMTRASSQAAVGRT